MRSEPNWTARMLYWPLLAAFVTFLAQWRDVGMNFAHMVLVAALVGVVVLAMIALLRMIFRNR